MNYINAPWRVSWLLRGRLCFNWLLICYQISSETKSEIVILLVFELLYNPFNNNLHQFLFEGTQHCVIKLMLWNLFFYACVLLSFLCRMEKMIFWKNVSTVFEYSESQWDPKQHWTINQYKNTEAFF